MNTCLYSGQKNFVNLYKRALANEIKLISNTGGRQTTMNKRAICDERHS